MSIGNSEAGPGSHSGTGNSIHEASPAVSGYYPHQQCEQVMGLFINRLLPVVWAGIETVFPIFLRLNLVYLVITKGCF